MDDYLNNAIQFIFGGGVTSVVVGTAVWVLRKMWRGDKIASADATGNVTAVDKLLKILDERQEDIAALRAALVEANARTDRAYAERNQVVEELGKVRAELAALRMEVQMLRGGKNEQVA